MKLMKFRKLYFALSLLVIIPGLISLFVYGLKPSIDFTGGSLLEVVIETNNSELKFSGDYDSVKKMTENVYELSSVQSSGENQLILRGKSLTNDQKNLVLQALTSEDFIAKEIRFESVGPTLGRELLIKTLTAIIFVAVLITFYVWRQFSDLKFGVSAILAMLHDSLILLGVFSLLGVFQGVEVDVLFVTALLTTLSFSVHDTIVVYDRIRELVKRHPRSSTEEIADVAVIETLSRSLNNSITIIIMLLALVLLGGASIKWFAVALLIGVISGTYSSTFVAVPLLLEWERLRDIRKKFRSS